jgi:predicted DNA-binding transcriptional regulator AlpA
MTAPQWSDDMVVVTIAQACEMMSISVDTLRRLHIKGEAPPRVCLSARRYGYRVAALKHWIKSREA